MRGFSFSSATVTWPDGHSDTDVAVAVRAGALVVRTSAGLVEKEVLDWSSSGRRYEVVTRDGTVAVRRGGGCGCRR